LVLNFNLILLCNTLLEPYFFLKVSRFRKLTIKFDIVGTRFSTVKVVSSPNCCCVKSVDAPYRFREMFFFLSTFSEKELSFLAQTLLLSFLIFRALRIGTSDAPATLVFLLTMNFKCPRNNFFYALDGIVS